MQPLDSFPESGPDTWLARRLHAAGVLDLGLLRECLGEVRARMSAPNELFVVETGDHSLQVTKTHTKQTGVTQAESDAAVLAAIEAFLAQAAE